MSKSMLIDATHAEETRVVVLNGNAVEEFDFEVKSRKQLRGNIYLAKVTRVEPSLQAAFVEYGGNRQGFLAFNEIHPDYYQIPMADREALIAELAEQAKANNASDDDSNELEDDSDELPENEYRIRQHLIRRYKIQEVIKRRQIMLIQVVKEERGNKGAALTTYLSLAGRYCVLMPNTARGGGISRKITNATDRKRLKAVAQSLEVPQGMGLIVRTAGAKRTKQELKRDYDYLLRVWENIRETTLQSNAPALIYEEEDLVKRAIRDMFDKDFETVLVEGDEGYRSAKDFIRMLMPSQAKKVQLYRANAPLFNRYGVEDILSNIYSPTVPLRSGGYLVINQTEALVAIDVNSGKSTKERNIEATALKTNLEAADEAARQMRLRDLAGLVVIDFIDMDEPKNNRAVEKRLKDALSEDRARVQMGKISMFGLMEISRQRRRTGVLEGTTVICPHCEGMGRVRSTDSAALAAMRQIDLEAMQNGAGVIQVKLPIAVALYILNEKQEHLAKLRIEWGLKVNIEVDNDMTLLELNITRTVFAHEVDFVPPERPEPPKIDSYDDDIVEDEVDEDDEDIISDESETSESSSERDNRQGRRRRRGRDRFRDDRKSENQDGVSDESLDTTEDDNSDEEDAFGNRRRRRGRRGGRRNGFEQRPRDAARDAYGWVRSRTPNLDAPYVWIDPFEEQSKRFERPDRPERPERSQSVQPQINGADDTNIANEGVSEDTSQNRKMSRRERFKERRRRREERPEGQTQIETNDAGDNTETDALIEATTQAHDPLGSTMPETLAPSSLVPKGVDITPVKRGKRPPRKPKPEMVSEDVRTTVEDVETVSEVVTSAIEAVTVAVPELKELPTEPDMPETATASVAHELALAEAELDPAEITSAPEKPKKGWWRR